MESGSLGELPLLVVVAGPPSAGQPLSRWSGRPPPMGRSCRAGRCLRRSRCPLGSAAARPEIMLRLNRQSESSICNVSVSRLESHLSGLFLKFLISGFRFPKRDIPRVDRGGAPRLDGISKVYLTRVPSRIIVRSAKKGSFVMKNKLIESPFLFPLSNGNSRKVYKPQLRRNNMAKNLASKLRTGAMIGLAGLALGATAPKANAVIAPQISTTISAYDVDQDLSRPGVQIRYNWSVLNKDPPASDWNEDAIWRYAIDANLEAKGMYGFQNNDIPEGFDFVNGSTSYFQVNANGGALPPGFQTSFSALIDQDQIIGNEQVGSYATANSGVSPLSNVTVPIPEPLTAGLLGAGALVALAARRIKDNYKYR